MSPLHFVVLLVMGALIVRAHFTFTKIVLAAIMAAFILVVTAKPCSADTMGVSLASIHDRGGLRTFTPGIYYSADSGVSLGAFSNSYGRLSTWAGYRLGDRYAVTLGVVTGYPRGAMPLVLPSVRFGGLRVSLAPRVLKSQTSSALHLSWEFNL